MQLIKVGFCAFGMSGKVFHAPFLKQHPGFTISAIVERSKNESEELYPEAEIYRSVEEMLVSADVDVVVVNTPIQTHLDYCKKAIAAGKHVIIEKPFTINLKDGQELTRLAKEKGVFLSVFQNRRFDRDFLQVRTILNEDFLGELKEVEMRFDRFRTSPSPKEHKENPNLPGSGALHDLGAHLIDQAVVLFGEPSEVFADVFTMKEEATANDYFEILLYYPDNLRVRLKSSVFTKEDHFAYKIHGSKGSFIQERSDNQEAELIAGALPYYTESWQQSLKERDGILNYIDNAGKTVREELWSEPGSYMYYFQEIYEHMVFESDLPSPANDILANMRIIDAAIESSATGRRIKY